MKKLIIFISIVILNLLNAPLANSSQLYSQIISSRHQNFSTDLILSQPDIKQTVFNGGEIQATFNVFNIQAQFQRNWSDPSGGPGCVASPVPQWDTYFSIHYSIFISTDSTFEKEEEDLIYLYIQIKLDDSGKPIWFSSNPNSEFNYEDLKLNIKKDLPLRQVFSQTDSVIKSIPITFNIDGGKIYYVKQVLGFSQNGRCIDRNQGIGSVGKDFVQVSSFSTPFLQQTISFSIPKNNVLLKNKAERINFSSSSGLIVEVIETTPKVCVVSGTLVLLKSVGKCGLKFSQSGQSGYAPASSLASFNIIATSKSSVNCSNGKTNRTITGTNPKCPIGFRKF
jgi:hypothetical protein